MNELNRLLFCGLFAYLSFFESIAMHEAMLSIEYTRLLVSLHVTPPWCRSGALCTTTISPTRWPKPTNFTPLSLIVHASE
jgi:hypothetical protein